MKLRYISIHFNFSTKHVYEDIAFIFESNVRFICNYLSKTVRKLKIETGAYKMLSINLTPLEDSVEIHDWDQVLSIKIHFAPKDKEHFLSLTKLEDRFEYFLSLLEQGYQMAVDAGYSEICIDKLLQLHETFRSGNYKNEWLWKKKQIKDKGIYIFFNCYFTTFDFKLVLDVYDLKKTKKICSGVIMQTLPDEICYDKDFRNLVITDDKIIILDFLNYPNFCINIQELVQGQVISCCVNKDTAELLEKASKKIAEITW